MPSLNRRHAHVYADNLTRHLGDQIGRIVAGLRTRSSNRSRRSHPSTESPDAPRPRPTRPRPKCSRPSSISSPRNNGARGSRSTAWLANSTRRCNFLACPTLGLCRSRPAPTCWRRASGRRSGSRLLGTDLVEMEKLARQIETVVKTVQGDFERLRGACHRRLLSRYRPRP